MVVHDDDMSGVMYLTQVLSREFHTGIFVSYPKGVPNIVLEGLTNSGNDIDLSKIEYIPISLCDEFFPEVISSNRIGVMPTKEVLSHPRTSDSSMTNEAIGKFLDHLRKLDGERPSSFILMNGFIPANIPIINGSARAIGTLCITIIHQDELFDLGRIREFNALRANHRTVLRASSIKNIKVKGGRLHILQGK